MFPFILLCVLAFKLVAGGKGDIYDNDECAATTYQLFDGASIKATGVSDGFYMIVKTPVGMIKDAAGLGLMVKPDDEANYRILPEKHGYLQKDTFDVWTFRLQLIVWSDEVMEKGREHPPFSSFYVPIQYAIFGCEMPRDNGESDFVEKEEAAFYWQLSKEGVQ